MKWIIMAIFEFYKDNTIASIKNRPEGGSGLMNEPNNSIQRMFYQSKGSSNKKKCFV